MPCSRFWLIGFWSASVSALAACHEPSSAQPSAAEPARTATAGSTAQPGSGASARQLSAGFESDASVAPSNTAIVAGIGSAAPPVASATPTGASALLDVEGEALPQTDQRPSSSSAAFQQRVDALASAIISGEAESAVSAFFPLVAYQKVKDVAKPERDYRFRLLAHFKRDILEYHRALGAAASQATFGGITVSERDAKWMAPGTEGNKLGYFRVLRSRLRFALPTGRSRDFELTSLISWRGEWYVVHLHGFK